MNWLRRDLRTSPPLGSAKEGYDTKDEIDGAREELDDLRAHAPKFAEGDLGRWKETYEKWLKADLA